MASTDSHFLDAYAASGFITPPLKVAKEPTADKITKLPPPDEAPEELIVFEEWHRAAAAMMVNEMPSTVVAAAFDKDIDYIVALQKQTFFKELLKELALHKGMAGLAKAMGIDSIIVLHELSMSAKTEAVRVRAAQFLVEANWGKVQPGRGILFSTTEGDPEEELERLRIEQEALNKVSS